jgi:ubiquitin-like modifier-activating enzyme ATG7
MVLTGKAYDKCPACSDTVLKAYTDEGVEFVMNSLKNRKYLEDLTGLTKLHEQTFEIEIDWDEDNDE